MGEHYAAVADQVREHLRSLVKTAGLPDTEESLEALAEGWLEKQRAFHEQTKANEMEEADSLEIEDGRGALIMTYSGSLLTIGPETEDGRTVEYTSIGLRRDVPESLKREGSVLAVDVVKDSSVEFDVGPIKSSSPVYAIAVAREDLSAEAEEELLGQVTMMLAEDFVEVNKTLIDDEA
jgi:hypothetical protein